MHYVYGLYDLENDCYIYIGKGSNDRVYYHRRAVVRDYQSQERNPELYERLSYLVNNDYLLEVIIQEFTTEDLAYNAEEFYTRLYGLRSEGGTLYNKCYGQWVMTDQARADMQPKRSATLSEKYKGEGNPFYGKHHTEESKRKISENNVGFSGRTHTDEWKSDMSQLLKGREYSDETIEKMRGPNKKTQEVWIYDMDEDVLHHFHSINASVRELPKIYPQYKWTCDRIKASDIKHSIRYGRFLITRNSQFVKDSRITFND